MHLRWIYVMDHAPLFAALTALFVISMVAVVFLVGGVVGDVLLGAVPTLFAVVVWAITNNAGYPNRDPVTLPHQRPENPAGSEPAWDPFAGERKAVVGGDPFAQDATGGSPPETVEPAIDDSLTAEDEVEDTDASAAAPRTHAPKARRAIEDNQPVPAEPSPPADGQPAEPSAPPASPPVAAQQVPAERTAPVDNPAAPSPDPGPQRGRKKHHTMESKTPDTGPRHEQSKNGQDKPAAATAELPSEEAESPPTGQPLAASPEPSHDQTDSAAAQSPQEPATPPTLPKAPRVEKPASPQAKTKPRRARKRPAPSPSQSQEAATPSDHQHDQPRQNPAEAARRAAARANREARTRHEAPVAETEDPSTSEAPLSPAEAAKRAAAARKRNRKRKAS